MTDPLARCAPEDHPAARLAAYFQATWPQLGLPENPRLSVEALGFERYRGDWLGAVISPVFIRLILLPAGGSLWGDIPPGQRRYVELAGGTQTFLAEAAGSFGPWQWSALCADITALPDMASARWLAVDGLHLATGQPALPTPSPEPAPELSRRGFFRRLAGQRPV